MAYTRLLRVYYRREQPIPADLQLACRLVRASTATQRKAVETVLNEFFELRADGWHNRRADEEITAYQAQASTNRRIAQSRSGQRTVNETLNEPSTKRIPNQEPLTKNQEPEKPKSKSLRTSCAPFGIKNLLDLGVEERHAADWLAVRKAKRAPLTTTALELLQAEAGKAGIPVALAVKICAEKSWQGFRADWDWRGGLNGESIAKPWWETSTGIEKKGVELGIDPNKEAFPFFKAKVFAAAGAGPWNQS